MDGNIENINSYTAKSLHVYINKTNDKNKIKIYEESAAKTYNYHSSMG